MTPDAILLTGRVALVTGGGAGIGQGIALGMARFGADVVVLDIDSDRGNDTVNKVQALDRECLSIPTDVMETDQIRSAVAQAREHFGRIDILVNNAGGVNGRPFMAQSERSWRRHVEINLISMFAATAEVGRVMIDGGRGGAIINVSSIEGMRAAPNFAVYAACKAGMINFTKTMALELAQHGIRVNGIAPDHTATPGNHGQRSGPVDETNWSSFRSPREQAMFDRVIPLGREGVVDECAGGPSTWRPR